MWLKQGNFSYHSIEDSSQAWQLGNPVVFSLVVASLATVLSYQLASIIFDLAFGLKTPGHASASDLIIHLLSEECSVFSILANLGISKTISRWRYHGIKTNQNCDNPPVSPKWSTLTKFYIVLLAAPIANLIAVILTIDTDSFVTFHGADFGGIRIGLNSTVVNTEDSFLPCKSVFTTLGHNERLEAKFFRCHQVALIVQNFVGDHERVASGMTYLNISSGFHIGFPVGSIAVSIQSNFVHESITFVYFNLVAQEQVYRIPQRMTPDERIQLWNAAADSLLNSCKSFSRQQLLQNNAFKPSLTETDTAWSITGSTSCDDYSLETMEEASWSALDLVGFLDAVDFRVLHVDHNGVPNNSTVSGSDIVYFKRRKSLVSLKVLFILVVCSVSLRLLVLTVTRNDLHMGLAFLVKDALQLPLLDSMLQNEEIVDYSRPITRHIETIDDQCRNETS